MSAAAVPSRTPMTTTCSSSREVCHRSAVPCGSAPCNSRRRAPPRLAAPQRQRACSGSGGRGGRRGAVAVRAAAEAEAPQQAGALVPDRQGYRSFDMDGCEFLIAETQDGRLDLRDAYVARHAPSGEQPAWRRVEGVEGIAGQPQAYKEVPWYGEYKGDYIEEKPGKVWIWRYYLLPILSREPELALSFDNIWVLDAKTASLAPCDVLNLAPPDTPPRDLRLRIRDDVVTIDTIQSLPDWETAAQARIGGVPAVSDLEAARLIEYIQGLEAARVAGTISDDEFEAATDLSWLAALQAGVPGGQAPTAAWDGGGEAPLDVEAFAATSSEEDVMGGWDQEMFEDLMPQYDDESDEADFEEMDSPAADY